jgi:hypothetical protein
MDTITFPIVMFTEQGEHIDSALDAESAASVLYGDLTYHEGHPRIIQIPHDRDDLAEAMARHAAINADCWGIPLDTIERVSA